MRLFHFASMERSGSGPKPTPNPGVSHPRLTERASSRRPDHKRGITPWPRQPRHSLGAGWTLCVPGWSPSCTRRVDPTMTTLRAPAIGSVALPGRPSDAVGRSGVASPSIDPVSVLVSFAHVDRQPPRPHERSRQAPVHPPKRHDRDASDLESVCPCLGSGLVSRRRDVVQHRLRHPQRRTRRPRRGHHPPGPPRRHGRRPTTTLCPAPRRARNADDFFGTGA